MKIRTDKPKRRLRQLAGLGVLVAFATGLMAASAAPAVAAPVYDVKATWSDTHLPPGGSGLVVLRVRNVGAETGAGALTVTDELPDEVTITNIIFPSRGVNLSALYCGGQGTSTLSCTFPPGPLPGVPAPNNVLPLPPAGSQAGVLSANPTGYLPTIMLEVTVDAGASGSGTNVATVDNGGASGPATDIDQMPFSATPASFGIVSGGFEADFFDGIYPQGDPARVAGDHPVEARVNVDLNLKTEQWDVPLGPGPQLAPVAPIRSGEFTLPRGISGNPEATPKCPPVNFAQFGVAGNTTTCPSNTQIGYVNVLFKAPAIEFAYAGASQAAFARIPIYSLEPPKGQVADFGFSGFGGLVVGHMYPTIDPGQNYAVKAVLPNVTSLVDLRGGEFTIWGVPGDPAHDIHRYRTQAVSGNITNAPFDAPIKPLLTNPMDCGFDNGGARIRIDSYQDPGNFTPVQEYGNPLNVSGCDDPRIRFEPTIAMQPTSTDAGGPTGLEVNLEVPQRDDTVTNANNLYAANGNVKGISTPPIKKAVVTLPEGMTLSPSAAQGLSTCTAAQIGLGTDRPVQCPPSSQYGELTIFTPILPVDQQPKGHIYIAKQGDHPFADSFLALYLVVEEPDRGILVKIAGKAQLDERTGQIKTSFDDLPQFPVSNMQMRLKGGVRAALVNPPTCGTKAIHAQFFSWHDPATPIDVTDSYEVTHRADGSPCVASLSQRPFAPHMDAGALNPTAGAYSPFAFRLTRTDDDQEFSQLGIELPPGLTAKLAGVSECSDAAIRQAQGRVGAGDGTLEQNSPSCPASSYIGTTEVGAGVGVPLTYVPGKVYLAGPYRGAPLSMVVISPAVVGPYDLGVIAVRSALHIDPETALVEVASDPFPLIYQGIPVRIRDIRVKVDRPNFALNPTSCAEKQISAHITGTGGNLDSTADDTGADLSSRFQASDCASLGFSPKLSLRLLGGTKRGSHPKLKATLRMPEGGANIAGASVALPRSEFLDQAHIRTVCTRVQFAAKQCPAGSIYGQATAKTPLLDETLSGPIYLRSSNNKLPDVVAVLGGKIEVNVVGRIDSVNGGIRNTFDFVPDAPVSWVTLNLQGGKKGLLINSRDLCKGKVPRASAEFTAQSGKELTLRPKMQSSCAKARKGHKKRR